MEQRLLKFMLIQLKVAAALLLIGMLSILFLSFKAPKIADDFWNQLGLGKEQGTEYISESFLDGYLRYYGARNIKNIAVGNRADVVRDLGAYAKQYVNSDKFRKLYAERRENSRPSMPDQPKTEAMIREEQLKGINASISAMEEFLKSTNADLKKMAQEGLPQMKKQLKEFQDPNNALIKMMADAEKSNYEYQVQRYKEDIVKWEQEHPADPKGLIVTRLKHFLSVTSDIDFDAQLKERSGHKIFVNAAYEQKSDDWKRAFRAGKEAVSAARAFAQQWLRELER